MTDDKTQPDKSGDAERELADDHFGRLRKLRGEPVKAPAELADNTAKGRKGG